MRIEIIDARMEALGWMYAYACNALDRGEDIRKLSVPELLVKFHQDMDEQDAKPEIKANHPSRTV